MSWLLLIQTSVLCFPLGCYLWQNVGVWCYTSQNNCIFHKWTGQVSWQKTDSKVFWPLCDLDPSKQSKFSSCLVPCVKSLTFTVCSWEESDKNSLHFTRLCRKTLYCAWFRALQHYREKLAELANIWVTGQLSIHTAIPGWTRDFQHGKIPGPTRDPYLFHAV